MSKTTIYLLLYSTLESRFKCVSLVPQSEAVLDNSDDIFHRSLPLWYFSLEGQITCVQFINLLKQLLLTLAGYRTPAAGKTQHILDKKWLAGSLNTCCRKDLKLMYQSR